MNSRLPSEIRVTMSNEPGRWIRYRLPARNPGELGRFGRGFLAAGGVVVLVGVPAGVGLGQMWGWSWLMVAVAAFVVGCGLVGLGALHFLLRAEIHWSQTELRAVEYLGPVRLFSRVRPIDVIERFLIDDLKVTMHGQALESEELGNLGLILAACRGTPPLALAPAYPRAWVTALANQLGERCRVPVADAGPTPDYPLMELLHEPTPVKYLLDCPNQPPASRARLEQHERGIYLEVPPAGLATAGSMRTILFAVGWSALLIGLVVTGIVHGAVVDWSKVIPFVLFLTLPLGMLAHAVTTARRRAYLAVVDGRLVIAEHGLKSTRRWDMPREDIEAIRVGACATSVNKQPMLELQIHREHDKPIGILAGRREDELLWIATMLRRALDVPAGVPAWPSELCVAGDRTKQEQGHDQRSNEAVLASPVDL